MVEKKHLLVAEPFEELKRRLGEAPIVSDLIVITKISGGKKKKRMIVNFKRSGISRPSKELSYRELLTLAGTLWEF